MQARRSFTLVELLIVISIIAILAGMAMAALAAAADQGKLTRARAQIAKIDLLLMEKWNAYRYRKVPMRFPANTSPGKAAQLRLYGLRELMRMELPDRHSDIKDGPAVLFLEVADDDFDPFYNMDLHNGDARDLAALPLTRAYRRKLTATATQQWEQSECLYLILSEMRDGDKSALSFFLTSEIGDIDGDGMQEILDPWGTPITFLRWAPGYSQITTPDYGFGNFSQFRPPIDTVVDTEQIPDGRLQPDPFDPLKADLRWAQDNPRHWQIHERMVMPFALRPLVISAGPDRKTDIRVRFLHDFTYATTALVPNDPYAVSGRQYIITEMIDHNPIPGYEWEWWMTQWIGTPHDTELDGSLDHGDNITNHSQS